MAQTRKQNGGSAEADPPSGTASKKPNAVWTAADDAVLVTTLENATDERADNGWKKGAWRAVAKALANPSVGGEKSVDGCRDHWTKQVCTLTLTTNADH